MGDITIAILKGIGNIFLCDVLVCYMNFSSTVTCYSSQAYNLRFPRSPRIPMLENSVILEDKRDEFEEVVVRRCQLHVDAPYLMKKVSFCVIVLLFVLV